MAATTFHPSVINAVNQYVQQQHIEDSNKIMGIQKKITLTANAILKEVQEESSKGKTSATVMPLDPPNSLEQVCDPLLISVVQDVWHFNIEKYITIKIQLTGEDEVYVASSFEIKWSNPISHLEYLPESF